MALKLLSRTHVKLKPLAEQVMVITGASSGIGRQTAMMAAARGARVVLVARQESDLRKAVKDIKDDGGKAICIKADVTQPEDIQRVIRQTHEKFGPIDTWVNNAGVEIWGKVEDIAEKDARQLFETNFWGLVEGSKQAVAELKQSGGALINLGSVESDQAFPLQSYYAASKQAVKAFTDSLRMELERDQAPISVTLIKPASIATPLPQHALNEMEEEVQLPSPLYRVEEVATGILYAATHPVRDVVIGGSGRLMSTLGKLAPGLMDKLGESHFFDAQKRESKAHDSDRHSAKNNGKREKLATGKRKKSNLYSAQGGQIEGDHPQQPKIAMYTRARMHPLLITGAMMALGMALVIFLPGASQRKGFKSLGKSLKRSQQTLSEGLSENFHDLQKKLSAKV